MRLATLGLVPLTLLLLACGDDTDEAGATPDTEVVADDEEAPSAPAGDGSGASGQITSTGAGSYDFAPTTCVVHEREVEVGGPGTAPDGGPVFVSLSAGEGYGELRIDLGTDDQFSSGDELLVATEPDVQISGSEITGTAVLRDGSGGPDTTDVTFAIDCG